MLKLINCYSMLRGLYKVQIITSFMSDKIVIVTIAFQSRFSFICLLLLMKFSNLFKLVLIHKKVSVFLMHVE